MTMADDASYPTGRNSNATPGSPPMPATLTTNTIFSSVSSTHNPDDNDGTSTNAPRPNTITDRTFDIGHEGPFVQPASYLRPRGVSHPMPPAQPERAIDREERQGLVFPLCSSCSLSTLLFLVAFWASRSTFLPCPSIDLQISDFWFRRAIPA